MSEPISVSQGSRVPNTLIKTRIVSENSVFFIQLTKHNGIVKSLAKKPTKTHSILIGQTSDSLESCGSM